jgi:hypothetical protein
MSLLQELEDLQRRVTERLQELQPLVKEHKELTRVAERLGVSSVPGATDGAEPSPAFGATPTADPQRDAALVAVSDEAATDGADDALITGDTESPPASAAPSRPARTRARGSGSSNRRRAGSSGATPAQRRERLLAVVAEQPGITIAALAQQLDVQATSLYRVVRGLQGEGALVKDGRQLRLAPKDEDAPAS